VPELVTLANIHQDYVQLLADVSESTTGVDDTVAAVERALANPDARSSTRQAVAADLFHEPGTATMRCAAALYEAIGLRPILTRQKGSTAGRLESMAGRQEAMAERPEGALPPSSPAALLRSCLTGGQ
jgi:hypothetical protein